VKVERRSAVRAPALGVDEAFIALFIAAMHANGHMSAVEGARAHRPQAIRKQAQGVPQRSSIDLRDAHGSVGGQPWAWVHPGAGPEARACGGMQVGVGHNNRRPGVEATPYSNRAWSG